MTTNNNSNQVSDATAARKLAQAIQTTANASNQAVAKTPAKISTLDFTRKAIQKLRTGEYKGIHSVYSGFNSAFKAYYGDKANPIAEVDKLVEAGHIVKHFAKGGVMLYLAADAPDQSRNGAVKTLEAILS